MLGVSAPPRTVGFALYAAAAPYCVRTLSLSSHHPGHLRQDRASHEHTLAYNMHMHTHTLASKLPILSCPSPCTIQTVGAGLRPRVCGVGAGVSGRVRSTRVVMREFLHRKDAIALLDPPLEGSRCSSPAACRRAAPEAFFPASLKACHRHRATGPPPACQHASSIHFTQTDPNMVRETLAELRCAWLGC